MKSQGDLEQEQWRSYSFLCSVKRKKETHQETRLWSTGSLTLADKKELMWGWFRCSYKSIKLGTTRKVIQEQPESQIQLLAVKQHFNLSLKRKLLPKTAKEGFSHAAKFSLLNSTTPSTDPTKPYSSFSFSLSNQLKKEKGEKREIYKYRFLLVYFLPSDQNQLRRAGLFFAEWESSKWLIKASPAWCVIFTPFAWWTSEGQQLNVQFLGVPVSSWGGGGL